MRSRLKLSDGDTLKLESSRSTGFMGETDITNYSILNSSGDVVGSVAHTEHMAVKGFRTTNSLVQKDALGQIVAKASW